MGPTALFIPDPRGTVLTPAPTQQRGVALLTAMLILAIVAVAGSAMLTRMNFAVHRSGNLWHDQQAWWYAVGVEQWIASILKRDFEHNDIDTLQDPWAKNVGLLPIEGGSITGQVIDLQSRFNINNLAAAHAEQARQQFERLLQLVSDIDPLSARMLTQSIHDWLDPNSRPTRPYGAEDNFYLRLEPSYRTANQLMASPSELRAVRGMSAELYRALKPYITALPEPTAINVNTASPVILASLAKGIDLATAKALVEKRQENPWNDVMEFLQEPALAGLGKALQPDNLTVSSSYFMASGTVSLGRAQLDFYSILVRGKNGITHVLRHSRDVR